MLSERSGQRGLWEADQLYLDMVGRETLYGVLASLRGQLFCDADFAALYCLDNGPSSVAPSLLATVLLLQSYDQASAAEAKAKADFDLCWKVALGIEIEARPFAKSTLQLFRAQLILHDKVREVFEQSLRLARDAGGVGHHLHIGPRRGEGHLQSAGGRHRAAAGGGWPRLTKCPSRNGPRGMGTKGTCTWGAA